MYSFRDPVRRVFSQANALRTYHEVFIENSIETYHVEYTKNIKKTQKVFGKDNVCYLIMEDLFKDNVRTEINKLEQFLNISINSMYPCCFVPDKGINVPKLEGLSDQWSSDQYPLTEELYYTIRNSDRYQTYYNLFEEFHGSLPADWGYPIDYGY